MGVPIMRGGRVLGVLVVQNRTQRNYTEEEVEALETVAMVLAEMLTGDSLLDATVAAGGPGGTLPSRLSGMVLNEGIAIGTAVPHRRGIVITQVVAEDPEAELDRKSVGEGKSVSVRVVLGGGRSIKKKKNKSK